MDNKEEDIDKSFYDLESYKEILELIPIIQKRVKIGMDRKMKKPMQIQDILKMDRDLMTGPQSLLQGKWTPDIIFVINVLKNPFFNDIRKALPKINTRTLTTRLVSLEENGLIKRNVHDSRPIRVSYEITPFGEGLITLYIPILVYLAYAYKKKK